MVVQQLVQSILEFPGMFVDIATQGPITALLVLAGAALIGIPVLIFAGLGLLWLGSALTPSRIPTRPQGE